MDYYPEAENKVHREGPKTKTDEDNCIIKPLLKLTFPITEPPDVTGIDGIF